MYIYCVDRFICGGVGSGEKDVAYVDCRRKGGEEGEEDTRKFNSVRNHWMERGGGGDDLFPHNHIASNGL